MHEDDIASMKKFSIITEADARVLTRGETIILARGGTMTPLAQDTLRERHVTVVREGTATAQATRLVPVADVRRVAIASDHSGLALRAAVVGVLRGRGIAVDDLGTYTDAPVDYPDVAAHVATAVATGSADAGIVIDGAGIGSAIAANKVRGIRAVMATSETIARYSRQHNGANVLTLGATLLPHDEATAIVLVWLSTAMTEARYIARLTKIADLEQRD
jgi:ribose 5-phosphate isomerase B